MLMKPDARVFLTHRENSEKSLECIPDCMYCSGTDRYWIRCVLNPIHCGSHATSQREHLRYRGNTLVGTGIPDTSIAMHNKEITKRC